MISRLIVSGVNQTARPLYHIVERLRGWQAGEYDVGLRADLGRRPRRHAADFFEFRERAAAITHHAPAALDEVLRDRHANLAEAYKPDGLHGYLTHLDYVISASELTRKRGHRSRERILESEGTKGQISFGRLIGMRISADS